MNIVRLREENIVRLSKHESICATRRTHLTIKLREENMMTCSNDWSNLRLGISFLPLSFWDLGSSVSMQGSLGLTFKYHRKQISWPKQNQSLHEHSSQEFPPKRHQSIKFCTKSHNRFGLRKYQIININIYHKDKPPIYAVPRDEPLLHQTFQKESICETKNFNL